MDEGKNIGGIERRSAITMPPPDFGPSFAAGIMGEKAMKTDKRHLLITMLEGQLTASVHDNETDLEIAIDRFEHTWRDRIATGEAVWTTQVIFTSPASR